MAAEPMVGGYSTYDEIPGTATITAITAEDNLASAYGDTVKVTFDFEPDPPTTRLDYRFSAWPDRAVRFDVQGGLNPSLP